MEDNEQNIVEEVEHDEDLYDANGNYDILGAKIKNTMSFRYNQGYLAS